MEELRNRLIQVSKVYGDQAFLRAGINVIPFVGGSIDILLSSSGQKFVIRRIENFINELDKQVRLLGEDKINKEFLSTEQGFDIIIKAFGSASRTRQTQKLNLYARIVRSSLSWGIEFEEDEPEIYLRIVEELSVKELRVAKYLFELKEIRRKNPEWIDPDVDRKDMKNDILWLSKKYPELNEDELVSSLVRLERTGLIRELVGTYMDYQGGDYLINPMFKKFLDFLGGFEGKEFP